MLNPQSPIPLYHQLADILIRRIRSGEYPPGTRIPPETSLAASCSIGRPTARQAIDLLVRKGMVERRRGSGTYVRTPDREVDLFSLAGTSSAFFRQGIPIEIRILAPIRQEVVDSGPDNPFSGGEAYFFSRLTLAGSEPVLIEEIFLDSRLFQGIEGLDLTGKSLAQVVSERFYMEPESGRQTFGVVFPDRKRAAVLKLTNRDPVLHVKRNLNFAQAANAVYSEFYCRTDRFVFSQTIGGAL